MLFERLDKLKELEARTGKKVVSGKNAKNLELLGEKFTD